MLPIPKTIRMMLWCAAPLPRRVSLSTSCIAGLSPACAGTTRSRLGRGGAARDHPRTRGDHGSANPAEPRGWGPSPHARGPPAPDPHRAQRCGTIPARAGTTRRDLRFHLGPARILDTSTESDLWGIADTCGRSPASPDQSSGCARANRIHMHRHYLRPIQRDARKKAPANCPRHRLPSSDGGSELGSAGGSVRPRSTTAPTASSTAMSRAGIGQALHHLRSVTPWTQQPPLGDRGP